MKTSHPLLPLFALCMFANLVVGQDTDSFGGFLNLKGAPGKYFHLEQIDGRTMLVTPDGHGFFSLGINHIGDIQGKRPDSVIDDHFDGKLTSYIDDAIKNLRRWNYNTVGYHNPHPIRAKMVSMADCYLINCANYHPDNVFQYPDVFDPAFHKHVRDRIANMVNGSKGNNKIIGYYWSDTPQWDIKRARWKRGTDWVSTIRRRPGDTAGKQRYVEFLKSRYDSDGEQVKARYNLDSADWNQIAKAPFDQVDLSRPEILEEDYAFLGLIAAEFYRVMGEATKAGDPERLIFGERYLVGDHPQVVLDEAVKWIDVLSYQPGGQRFNGSQLDALWERYNKPIMLCDHSVSFRTSEYPNTMWNQVANGQEAGRLISAYKLEAIRKPYVIGYHRCQYISRLVAPGSPQLKQGVLQTNAVPYPQFAAELAAGNAKLLDFFSQGKAVE